MKFKEFKNKSEKELQKLLSDFREKVRELRFKAASDQLKNVRELREVKRTIARLLFLLNKNKEKPSDINKSRTFQNGKNNNLKLSRKVRDKDSQPS